jgi:hypothetical protein
MPDYTLIPVDYQPDFSDYSLVPVDYDPFAADDVIRKAQVQAEIQPQQPATAIGQPNAGAPTNNAQAAAAGESYDPDLDSANGVPGSGQPYNPSAAPISPPGKPTVDWSRNDGPFGELKAATYTPTQHIGNFVASALMGLGMKPYTANDLTSRVGNVLGLTPLGVAGSALDLIDAKRRDDLGGAAVAAAGMLSGAKGGLSARPPAGKFYSVLFETKLGPTSYPGSRRAHNQKANEDLLQAMEGDVAYARAMENEGVILQRTPTGLPPRTPPPSFSWHHGDEPGVMQLVPREQHDRGSIFQDILHPDGRGGFSKWGK